MTTTKELKKALAASINMEMELYDFCEQCLKEIYKDETDQHVAICTFEENYEYFEMNGCIQGLCYINRQVNECKKNREKAKLEN